MSDKPQASRYLKTACDCCGWTARVTAKHLKAADILACPVPTCGGDLKRA